VPTSNERKALWFLAFVALSGSGVRLWRAKSPLPTPAESAALTQQIARVDSARAAAPRRKTDRRNRAGDSAHKTPGATEPVNLDRASAQEIERLPGIGPALAQRIVAHRDSAGPFGEIDALCAVRGVGPVLAERLRPLVTFSGPHRPVSAACGDASPKPSKRRTAGALKPS
jgi:competence ComEA-like helix-hairpin-helix protein